MILDKLKIYHYCINNFQKINYFFDLIFILEIFNFDKFLDFFLVIIKN